LDQTWSYSKDYEPSAPVLKVLLQGIPAEFAVDTGFSGTALVPFPLFESAGLQSRMLPDEFTAVMPDLRKIPVLTALGDFVIGDINMQTRVHAAPNLNKKLIGREFLKAFIAVLNGRAEEFTLKSA
jgi:predicted aspartyl protease